MEVKRVEHKIILNQAEAMLVRKRLDPILPKDIHCLHASGYDVRSLYFDTIQDRCCVEKEEGLRIHEKIRIRVYGNDDSLIKLESKRKYGSSQIKESLIITRATYDALLEKKYEVLLNYEQPLAKYFYKKLSQGMVPKVVIQYDRISYSIPTNNIRITIDSNIRASECNFDLFQDHLQTYPILNANQVILEVKYNHFLLNYIKKALSGLNHSPTSFSKYFGGRRTYRRFI